MITIPQHGFVHECDTGRRVTGSELRAEAARRAGTIARHLGPGRRNVVIAHGNSADFLADLLAVWQAGGCAICANPGLTPGELENVAEFAEAALVLTEPDADLPAGVTGICTWAHAAPAPAAPPLPVQADDAALILFTSGTTGDPKGVVHSHRSLAARVALNLAHLDPVALTRSLCILPTHFGHGLIGNCLTPLAAGCGLFLMPGGGMSVAARLGAAIDEHAITFLSSVPSLWKLALRVSAAPDDASLRRVSIGSAPLAADLWRAVGDWAGGAEIANMYGLTETANWVGGASSEDFAPEDGLLGRLWGGSAAVRGEDGGLADTGRGELMLRVPTVMTGYYRRPDLTAEVLDDGWYATGDAGEIAADGTLRLTGRRRYVIIRGGINVFPEELDILFERHPDVAEACAFGRDDEIGGQSVALAVALRPGATIDAAALDAWARKRLRAEAMPQEIHLLPEIPKTDRGKLNRDLVAAACPGRGSAP